MSISSRVSLALALAAGLAIVWCAGRELKYEHYMQRCLAPVTDSQGHTRMINMLICQETAQQEMLK